MNSLVCVYCFEDKGEKLSCCGENHFLKFEDLLEREKELNEIDRQVLGASGIVYDPPMSETDEYLLKKEREEEHKSYDY